MGKVNPEAINHKWKTHALRRKAKPETHGKGDTRPPMDQASLVPVRMSLHPLNMREEKEKVERP